MDWQTFGHKNPKNILERQITSGNFPHAYLFKGPEAIGKKSLALEFAKKLLNVGKLENHPDFRILDAQSEVGVEQVISFIGQIGFKPFLAKWSVSVIDNVQELNVQSCNALLKTLEEPGSASLIILISNSQRLLPTIVSRCQILNFNTFSRQSLEEFAKKNNLEASQDIFDLSFGRTARLVKLCKDLDFRISQKALAEDYSALISESKGQRLSKISNLAELETEDLRQNLLAWFFVQAERLSQNPGEFLRLRALLDALEALKKNFNKKLVLQSLMLKI